MAAVVRYWKDRADGEGRYPTVGVLERIEGDTATVSVVAGGRNVEHPYEVFVSVPVADVELWPSREPLRGDR